MFGVPRALGDGDMNGERFRRISRGSFVLVGEIVQHLFDANRIRSRKLVVLHEVLSDLAVGRSVDVDGKGALRVIDHALEGVVNDPVVLFTTLPRTDALIWGHPHRDLGVQRMETGSGRRSDALGVGGSFGSATT